MRPEVLTIIFYFCSAFITSSIAYNGTKLVLSGRQRIYNWTRVVEQEDQVVFTASGERIDSTACVIPEIERFRDVYILDLETSIWTRLADGPFAYTDFVTAVAGDHLVLYGSHSGFMHVRQMDGYDYGAEISVLNLKENAWVDRFTPSRDGNL